MVVIACIVIGIFAVYDAETVEGNEIGVLETWGGGVSSIPLQPKSYLINRCTESVYRYSTSTQIFVMNNVSSRHDKVSAGREQDAYTVQSSEGQDLIISLNLQWRIDPVKVIEIHKTVRNNIEEKLIRTALMKIVKDEATTYTAIDAYSGPGLVKLQAAIFNKLHDPKFCNLKERGIIVEGFVIERIDLDQKYVAEIRDKQVAVQRRLRFEEEQKTAVAQVEKVKAETVAEAQKAIANAQRDKEVGILEAEKRKQQMILDAEAEKQKMVIAADAQKQKLIAEAQGQRDADLLKAQGTIALGEADAKAQKLKYEAYNVAGAENYVKVEVAKHMASAVQNIKGYLPNNVSYSLIAADYMKSIGLLTGTREATAPAAK